MSFTYQTTLTQLQQLEPNERMGHTYYWWKMCDQYVVMEWDDEQGKYRQAHIICHDEEKAILVCEALNDYEER